jgi:hypothetical protein
MLRCLVLLPAIAASAPHASVTSPMAGTSTLSNTDGETGTEPEALIGLAYPESAVGLEGLVAGATKPTLAVFYDTSNFEGTDGFDNGFLTPSPVDGFCVDSSLFIDVSDSDHYCATKCQMTPNSPACEAYLRQEFTATEFTQLLCFDGAATTDIEAECEAYGCGGFQTLIENQI